MTLVHCTCCIVPSEVLKRFSQDRALSEQQREHFANTIKIDAEMRRLRTQATKLTRVAVAAAPAINVFDCKHRQTLPGVPVANPGSSADATARRVFADTTAVATFYSQVFGVRRETGKE